MSAWDDPEGDERLEEEKRMDTVTRHTPAPRTLGPGRMLYELAGPADPTYDELSDRMRQAYQTAARYLVYQQAVDSLPSIEQPPAVSGVDEWECQVGAAVSVLKRSPLIMGADGGDLSGEQWRSLAEELVAAVDTGI